MYYLIQAREAEFRTKFSFDTKKRLTDWKKTLDWIEAQTYTIPETQIYKRGLLIFQKKRVTTKQIVMIVPEFQT